MKNYINIRDNFEYDTFQDFYIENPQKVLQVLGFLIFIGMSLEQAKREVEEYIALQNRDKKLN